MRTAPASIEAMLGTTQLTLSRCAKIRLRDGFEMGFTDHDIPLTVALDNDLYEPLTYSSGHGLIVGDTDLAIGLDADNTEASVPINEMITRAHILSRRFHMAKVWTFDCDWTQAAPEPLEIMAGHISMVRPGPNMAVFEIRSQADLWDTVVGSVLTPRCRADFGDEKCGATPTNYSTTVTDVISNMRFNIDLPGSYTDDFFRFGEVEFMSGDLAGTWPFEVVSFDGYEQEVEVLAPMPRLPQIGDELLIRDGCSRLKSSEDATIPTCATHNNVLRFRGFDQTPGSDRYLRFPVPGQTNE